MEESENPENGPTPKNEDSPALPAKSCALCGCSTPAVRCDRCSSQTFCLSCDDMYHRHPKRRLHLRKAVDSIWNSARSPRLRRKTDLPGDPSKIPIPPPRSRRKERHTIGGRVFLKPGHELGSFGHSKMFDTKNITVPPKDSFLKPKLSPTSTEETYENEAAFSANHVSDLQKKEEIYENDNVNINQEENTNISGLDHNPWNSSISPIQVSIPSSTPEMIENGQHFGFPPKSHSRSITDLTGGAVSPGGHHAYHFPHPYPYMHPAVHPPYSHSMAHLNCAQCLSSSWSNLMSPHPSPYFHPMQWGPPSNGSLGRGGPPAAQSHLKHSHGDLGPYPDPNLHFPYHGGVFYPPGVSIPDPNLMKDLGQQSAGIAKVKRSPSSSRSSRHAQSTEDLRNTHDVQSPENSASKSPEDGASKSPEASSNGLVNKVKQEKMEEEPLVPVAPKEPWSCLHCTFINPPGIYICQVCCKTSYGNKTLTDSEENLNNAPMVDSRNSESPMELVNMDAEIMSSEYAKHKAQKADEGICQDSLETSLENEEAFKEICGGKELKDADLTVMLTTETQTSTTTKSTDVQTQNIICNTMASSTDSIFPKQEMSIQTELEELPKLCSVATDPMISSHSMESLMSGVSAPPYHNRRAGWGRGASFSTQSLYERGRSRSPLPRSSSLYNEAYSFGRDSSLPPEEMLHGWNQSWLMTDPMYYKPHNLPEQEQALPKGDYFDGTWGSMDRLNRRVKSRQAKKQESLHRPKLHRSLDDLKSDKTQHDVVHSQELLFLQTVKEAERCGFSLEDLHVAYLHCGRENPVFWLEDNWSSMVKNVIALAAKYGEDNEENDVGVISASEAKDALHIHRGDIWDAVTECIENRQRKILELTVRGNFTQKQISEALTKNEGNVELAYADLFRASNKRHKFILSPGLSEDSEDLNVLIQTEEGMDNATTSVKFGKSTISSDSKTDKKKSDFLTKLTSIRQAQSERRKAREEKEMVRETITSEFPSESPTLTGHESEMVPSPEVMEERKSQSPETRVDLEETMPQYLETGTTEEERKEIEILSKDEPDRKPVDNIILTDDKKDHDDNIPVDYDTNWIDSQGEWIEEYSDEQWEDEGNEHWVSLQKKFHNMEKELAEEAMQMAALWEKEELEDDVFEEDPKTVIETHVRESDQHKTEQDEKFQQWVKVNLENNYSEEEEQTNELKLDVKTQAEVLSKSVEFDDTAICSSPLQHYPTEFDLSSKSLIEPDWVEVHTDAIDESKIEESNVDVSNANSNQYEFMGRQSPSEQDLRNQELCELENSDTEWEKIDFEDIQKIKCEEEPVLSDRDIEEFNLAADERKLEFTNTLEDESLNVESSPYFNEKVSNSSEYILKEMNNISESKPTAETRELKEEEQKLSQEVEEFNDIQKPRPPVRRKSKLNASAIEEALKNQSKNQDVVSDTGDVPPALPVKVKDKNLEQSSIQDVYAIPVKVKKSEVEESSSLLAQKFNENYDEQKGLRCGEEKEMSPPVSPLKPPRLNISSSPIETQKTSPSEIEASEKNASRLGFSKDASPVTSLSNESDSNCFADSESDPEIKIVRQKMHRKISRHEDEEMEFQDIDVKQDTELPTGLSTSLEKKPNKHHILMQELDFDPELPIPIGTRGRVADDLSSPKAFREGSARPLQLFKASKSDTSPIVSPIETKSDTFISTSEKRLDVSVDDQKQSIDSPSQPIISSVSPASHTLDNKYEQQEMNDYYNTAQKEGIALSMKHKATDGQESNTFSQLPKQNVAVPVNDVEYYNVVEQKQEMKPEILNDNVKLQNENMSSNIEQIEESQLPNISDNTKSNASDEIIEDPVFTGMEASSAAADYFFGRYNEVTITRPKKKTIIKVDRSGMPLMPKVMSSSEIKIPPPSKPLLSPMEQSASPVLGIESESKEKTSQPSLSSKISDSSVTLSKDFSIEQNKKKDLIEQKQEPAPTEILSFAEDYFFGSYNDIVPPKKPKKSATVPKLPQLPLSRIQEVPESSTVSQTTTLTAVTTSTFTVSSGSLESVASMPLSVSDESQFESMIDADTISTTSEVYYMAEDVIQDQNIFKAYDYLQDSNFNDKGDMKQRTVHFEELQPPVVPPPRKNRSNSFSKSSVTPGSISVTNKSFEFHSTRDLDSGVLDKKKLLFCSEDFKIIQGHDPSIFPSDVPSLSNELPDNLLSSEISIHESENLQNVPDHILKHEKYFEKEDDQEFLNVCDFSDAQSLSKSNLVCENILSQEVVHLNNERLEKVSHNLIENSPSNEISLHFNESSATELKESDIENLISDFRSISEDLQDLNEILFPLAPMEKNNLQETLKGVHLEQDSSILKNEENYTTTIAEEGLKVVEETQNVINSLCDLYFSQSYDVSTSNEAETFDVKNNNRDLTYDSENEWKMNEERNNSLNASFIENPLYNSSSEISSLDTAKETEFIINDIAVTSDSTHEFPPILIDTTTDAKTELHKNELDLENQNVTIEMLDQDHQTEITNFDSHEIKSSSSEILSVGNINVEEVSNGEVPDFADTRLASNIFSDIESGKKLNETPYLTETQTWENAKIYEVQPLSVICQAVSENRATRASTSSDLFSLPFVEGRDEEFDVAECILKKTEEDDEENLVKETEENYPLASTYSAADSRPEEDDEEDLVKETEENCPLASTYSAADPRPEQNLETYLCDELEVEEVFNKIYSDLATVDEPVLVSSENDSDEWLSINADARTCDKNFYLFDSGTSNEALQKENYDLSNLEASQEAIINESGNITNNVLLQSNSNISESFPASSDLRRDDSVRTLQDTLSETRFTDVKDECEEVTYSENADEPDFTLMSHFYEEWFEDIKPSAASEVRKDLLTMYATYYSSDSSLEGSENASENEDFVQITKDNFLSSTSSESLMRSNNSVEMLETSTNSYLINEMEGETVITPYELMRSNNSVEMLETSPTNSYLINEMEGETVITPSQIFSENMSTQNEIEAAFSSESQTDQVFPQEIKENLPFTVNEIINPAEYQETIKNDELEVTSSRITSNFEISTDIGNENSNECSNLLETSSEQKAYRSSKSCQTDDSFEEDQFFDSFDDTFTIPSFIDFPFDKSLNKSPVKAEIGIQCSLISADVNLTSSIPENQFIIIQNKTLQTQESNEFEDLTEEDSEMISAASSVQSEYLTEALDEAIEESNSESIEESDSDFFLDLHSSYDDDNKISQYFSRYADIDSDTGFSSGSEIGNSGTLKSKHTNSEGKTPVAESSSININQIPDESSFQLNKAIPDTTKHENYFASGDSPVLDSNTLQMNFEIQGAEDVLNKDFILKEIVQEALSCESTIVGTSIKETEGQAADIIYGLCGESISGNETFVNSTTNQIHELVDLTSGQSSTENITSVIENKDKIEMDDLQTSVKEEETTFPLEELVGRIDTPTSTQKVRFICTKKGISPVIEGEDKKEIDEYSTSTELQTSSGEKEITFDSEELPDRVVTPVSIQKIPFSCTENIISVIENKGQIEKNECSTSTEFQTSPKEKEATLTSKELIERSITPISAQKIPFLCPERMTSAAEDEDQIKVDNYSTSTELQTSVIEEETTLSSKELVTGVGTSEKRMTSVTEDKGQIEIDEYSISTELQTFVVDEATTSEEMVERIVVPVFTQQILLSCAEKITSVIEDKDQVGIDDYSTSTELQTSFKEEKIALTSEELIERAITPISIQKVPFSSAEERTTSITEDKGQIKIDEYSASIEIETSGVCEEATLDSEELVERFVTPISIEKIPFSEFDLKFVPVEELNNEEISFDDAAEKESTPTVEYFYGPLPLSVETECMQEKRDNFYEAVELLNECVTEAQRNISENEQEFKTSSLSSSGEDSIKDDDSFSDAYCSLRNDDDYNSDSISEYFVLPEAEFVDTLTPNANEFKLAENIQDDFRSNRGFDFVAYSKETQNINVIGCYPQSEIIPDQFSNDEINRTIGEKISTLAAIKNNQSVNQISISPTESSLSTANVCDKTVSENAESNEISQIVNKEKSDNTEITESLRSSPHESTLYKKSNEVEQLEISSELSSDLSSGKQTNLYASSNSLRKISDADEVYIDTMSNIPLEITLNKSLIAKELDEVNVTQDTRESKQSHLTEDVSNNIKTETLKSLCENLLVKCDGNISLLPELPVNSSSPQNVSKESELEETSSLGDSNKTKISGDIPLVPSDVIRYLYYDDSITFEGDIEDETESFKSSPLEHDTLGIQKIAFNQDSVLESNSLSPTYVSDSRTQSKDGKIVSKENILDFVSPIVERSETKQTEYKEIDRNISEERVPSAKFVESKSIYSQSETTDQWFEADTSDSQQPNFESSHSSYPKISSTSEGNDLPCISLSNVYSQGNNQVYVSKDFRPDSDEMTDISTHFTMTDDSDKFSDIESDNSFDNFDERFYYDVENPEYNESAVFHLENSPIGEKDIEIINEKTGLKAEDDQLHLSLIDQYSKSELIEENRLVIDMNGNITTCGTNKSTSLVSAEIISSSACGQFSKVDAIELLNANKFSAVESTTLLPEMLLSNENQSELPVIDNSELSVLENSEYCLASDSASSESEEFFPPEISSTSINELGKVNQDGTVESELKVKFVDGLTTAEIETTDTVVSNIRKCDIVSTVPVESDLVENSNFEQNIEGIENVICHEVETDQSCVLLSEGVISDISTANEDQIVRNEMSSIVKQKDVMEAEEKEKSVDALQHFEQLPAMSDGIQPESISILDNQKERSLTLVSNNNLHATAECINVVDLRGKQSTELDSGYAPALTVDSNLPRTEGLTDILFTEEDNLIVDFKGNFTLGESIKTDSAELETSIVSDNKCIAEFSESVSPFKEQLGDNSEVPNKVAVGFHDFKLHQETEMGLTESKTVARFTDEVSSSKADNYFEENTEFSLTPSLKSDESVIPISSSHTDFSLEDKDVTNSKIKSKEVLEIEFINENNILPIGNTEKHHELKQLKDSNNSIHDLNSEEENYHSLSDTFPPENSFNTCNGTESTSFYSMSEHFDDTLNIMSDDDFTDVPSHATFTEDTDFWSDVESDVFFEADHLEVKNFVLDRETTPIVEKSDDVMRDSPSEDNVFLKEDFSFHLAEYEKQTTDLCNSNLNETNAIETSELLPVSSEVEITNLFSISEQVPSQKIVKLDQSEITEHSTNYNVYQFSVNETIPSESGEQFTGNQTIIEVEKNQKDERTTVPSSDAEHDGEKHSGEFVGKFEMPVSSSAIVPINSISSDVISSIDNSHEVNFENLSTDFATGETCKLSDSETTLEITLDNTKLAEIDHETDSSKHIISEASDNSLITISQDFTDVASFKSINDECEELSDSEATNPPEDILLQFTIEKKIDFIPDKEIVSSLQEIKGNVSLYEIENVEINENIAVEDLENKCLENLSNISEEIAVSSNTALNQNGNKLDCKESSNVYETSHDSVTKEQISESASSKLSAFEDKILNISTEDTIENGKCTVPVEGKLEMVLENESNVMLHDVSETASYDSITGECEKLSDSESTNLSEDFLHSPKKKQFDIINQDTLQDSLRKLVIQEEIFKSVPSEVPVIDDHVMDILNENKVESEKLVYLTTNEKLETALESETNETLPDISEITCDSIADECEKVSDSDSTNLLDDSLYSFKEDKFDVVSSNVQDDFKTANIEEDFSESASFRFSAMDEENAMNLDEKEKSAAKTFDTSKVISGNERTSNSGSDDTKENYLKAESIESILSPTCKDFNVMDNSNAISDEVFTDAVSSNLLAKECNFVAATDEKEVQLKEYQTEEISSGEVIDSQNVFCSDETSDKLALDIHFADTTFKSSDNRLKNDTTEHLFIEHFAEMKSLGEHLQVAESFAIFDEDMAILKIHEEIGEASLRVEKTEESDYWLEADTEYSISEFEDEAISLSSKEKSDPVCAPVLHVLTISEENKNIYKTASQLSGDNATDISVSSFFTDPGHSDQISDTCADMSLREGTTENSDKWSDIEGEGLSDEGLCDLEQAMEIDKFSSAVKENKINSDKDADKSVSPIEINVTDSDGMKNLTSRSEFTLEEKQVVKESKSDISLIIKNSEKISSEELEVKNSNSGANLTKVISDKNTIIQEKSPLSSEFSASSLTISGLSDDEFTSVTPLDTAGEESDKLSDISESSVNEIEDINMPAATKGETEFTPTSDKKEAVLQSVDSSVNEVSFNLNEISRNNIVESPNGSTRILTEKESDLLKTDLITSERIQEAKYLDKNGENLSSTIIKPSFSNTEDSHLSSYEHIPALDEVLEESGVDSVENKVIEQLDVASNEEEKLLEIKQFETRELDEEDEMLSENFLETIPEDGYECNENLDEDEYLEDADDFHENFEDNELDEDGYPTLNTPYIINEDEFVYPLQYPDWIEESFDLKEYGIDAVLSGSESDIHGYGIQEEFDDVERSIDLNVSNFDEALGNLMEESELATESFKTLSNGTSSHLRPSDKEHDSWSTADAISIEDDDYPDHDDVLSKIDELLAEDFKDFDDKYKDNKDAEELLETRLDTPEAVIKDHVSENQSNEFAKNISEKNSFPGGRSNSSDLISEIPASVEVKMQVLSTELNSKIPLSGTVDDVQNIEVPTMKNDLKRQLSSESKESQIIAENVQPPSISDGKQSKFADESSVTDNQTETIKLSKENNSTLNSEEQTIDLAAHQSEKRSSVDETGFSAVTLKDSDLLESTSKSITEVKETGAVQDRVCERTLNIVGNDSERLPSKESVSSRLEDTTVPDIPQKQKNKTDIVKTVESETAATSSVAGREKKITSTMEDGVYKKSLGKDTVESDLGTNIPTDEKVTSSVKNSVTDEAPALPRKKRRERPSLEMKSTSSSSESLTSDESLSLKEEDSCEAAFQSSSNIPEVPTRRRRSVQSPSPRSRRRRSSNDSTSSSTSKSSIHSSDSSAPDVSKKRLSIDERVMKLQNEGKCSNKETAFIAAKLIEMQFEEEDALLASKQCSSVYHAIKFLTQLCELCNCRFPINLMVSLVHCTHRACKECLKAHFTSLIYDRSVFHLLCPICHMPDITDQNIQEYFNHLDMMLRNVLESGVYDLFQRKLRDEVLTKDPNFHWCSQCSSGFIASPRLKKLYCPDCSAITCASCHQTWELEHEGVHCERFQQWKDMHTPEPPPAGLVKYLTERGITCPSCGLLYAQACGGCLMYKCGHCSFEFCGFCVQPFKRGKDCSFKSCISRGMHAHHPINCLFYIRDKEISEIQMLLEEESVTYLTIPPKDQIVKSRCQVREQKNVHGLITEDRCGRDIVPYCAGLCKTHYYEYLAELLKKKKISPLPIMTTQDLQFMLRKSRIHVPEKVKGETNDEYYKRLTEVVTSNLV